MHFDSWPERKSHRNEPAGRRDLRYASSSHIKTGRKNPPWTPEEEKKKPKPKTSIRKHFSLAGRVEVALTFVKPAVLEAVERVKQRHVEEADQLANDIDGEEAHYHPLGIKNKIKNKN